MTTPPFHVEHIPPDPARFDAIVSFFEALDQGGEPFGPLPRVLRRGPMIDPEKFPEATTRGADEPAPLTWPALPLEAGRSLTSSQVARAVLAILSDEDVAGAGTEAGLSPARIKRVLTAAGIEPSTVGRAFGALLLWLARAGVLAAPARTDAPWATPRALVTLEADAVCERLNATPPPTPDEVRAERTTGLK